MLRVSIVYKLVTNERHDGKEEKKKRVLEREDCDSLTLRGNPEALRTKSLYRVMQRENKNPSTNTRSFWSGSNEVEAESKTECRNASKLQITKQMKEAKARYLTSEHV